MATTVFTKADRVIFPDASDKYFLVKNCKSVEQHCVYDLIGAMAYCVSLLWNSFPVVRGFEGEGVKLRSASIQTQSDNIVGGSIH